MGPHISVLKRYNAILALCMADYMGHFRYIKTHVPGSLGDRHA
jgi:hypothetical protein